VSLVTGVDAGQAEEHGDGGHPQDRHPAHELPVAAQVEGARPKRAARDGDAEQDRQGVGDVQADGGDGHHGLEGHQAP